MKKYIFILLLLTLSSCQSGKLVSNYTGGVSKDMLVNSAWQEINTSFDGTYFIWDFINETNVNSIQRGASIEYTNWIVYDLPGPEQPNPENQGVFRMSGSVPGISPYEQYMFVWIIDSAATQAYIRVFTDSIEISRLLLNLSSVHSVNYHKISKAPTNS